MKELFLLRGLPGAGKSTLAKSIDEMINEIRYKQAKNTTAEIPNPAEFMMLGETAFEENVHEKLRETLSPTEKQM
jgi:predicted kinase